MGITIVATPSATNANSFITEVEFIAYLAARLNVPAGSTVTGTTCTEDEKKAMIEATRELNDLRFVGDRGSVTQSLAWPRAWAVNPDAPTLLLDPLEFIPIGAAFIAYFAVDEIPVRVKDATCELAMQFVKAGTTDLAAVDPTLGITRERVDVIEIDYASGNNRPQGLARFPRVISRLSPILSPEQSSGVSMVRT